MKTYTLELPTLYGDHHVVEVRRLLFEIPGVADVYASSAYHLVEVQYDPQQVDEAGIRAKLEAAGYLGELSFPTELGRDADASVKAEFRRHTAVFGTTRNVVAFAQNVHYEGRPLWPCPGIGAVKMEEEN